MTEWFVAEQVLPEEFWPTTEKHLDERWAYVNGFPDYLISDQGRVFSTISNSFIKPTPNSRTGHEDICLWKNSVRHHRYIHRLVADAFLSNPENRPIVRHLNDSPTDNYYKNLAWGTQLDNVHDMIANGTNFILSEKDREKAMRKRRKPVRMTDLRTGNVVVYESQQEAARQLGISQTTISNRCLGRHKNVGTWKFEFEVKE